MSSNDSPAKPTAFAAHLPARRGCRDGIAVAGIASRLGRGTGQTQRRGNPKRASAEADGRAVHGNGGQSQSLVGKRRWRGDGTKQKPTAAGTLERQTQRHQRVVQPALDPRRHPSRNDRQHPVGNAAHQGRGPARRHQLRSGAGGASGAGYRSAQPGTRLRAAADRLPRNQLFDGVQFAYLLAEPGFPRAVRGVPVARVRQSVRERRQSAAGERP